MEFTVDRKKFLEALDRVACAVDKGVHMPVLAHVQLTCSGALLAVRATDLKMAAEATVEVSAAKPGTICVPHGVLVAVLRGRADPMVRVRVNDKHALSVDAEGSRRKTSGIGCMPGDDFPTLDASTPSQSFEAQPLLAALADVAHAMSTDDSRPHLCGTLVTIASGVLTSVATDGHRLAVSRHALASDGEPVKVLLHKDFAAALRARPVTSFGVVKVALPAQTWVVAQGPGFSVRAQPIDQAFPSYEQVVPTEHDRRLTAARRVFADTVAAAQAAGGKDTLGVVLTLREDGVDVTSDNPERCVFEDGFAGTVEGKPLKIGFNVKYLSQALASHASENVIAEFSGELDPCVLRSSDKPTERLDVLMPMRV